MTRETKIGLVMVLVLCAAGGFVFYKKYAKQQERAAAFAAENEEGTEGDDERPTAKRKGQVDPKVTPIHGEAEEDGDPFGDAPKTAKKSKGKIDDFGEQAEPEAGAQDLFEPKKNPLANKRPRPQPVDDGDPFGGAEEPPPGPPGRRNGPPPRGFEDAEFEPQPRGTRPGAMTAESEPPGPPPEGEAADDFSDPFGGPVARSAPPGPPANVEPEEPGELMVTGNEAGDAFGPPGRATPMPRGRAMPQPAGEEFNPQPRSVRQPTPVAAESDPFGSPNPTPRGRTAATPRPVQPPNGFSASDFEPPATARPTAPPRATAPPPRTVATSDPFAGATTAANDQRPTLYEVQANDNYWSISKKQYGTYRYFDALAKYNAERVPDPTKLRPGMKVMTPPPQALEARFPEMFGKGGAVTASYVPESETDAPGLFRAKSGQPMYRIGPSDTLTTIARAHLGRQSRWIQIFEMNRDQLNNPEQLKVGAVLRLPLDASSVRVSSGPLERR